MPKLIAAASFRCRSRRPKSFFSDILRVYRRVISSFISLISLISLVGVLVCPPHATTLLTSSSEPLARGSLVTRGAFTMRRDRSGSTNSAYGKFYDRASPGARDAKVVGVGGISTMTPSSGRRGGGVGDRQGDTRHVSLDHLPAVTVKANDLRRVGAFHGSVGRTNAYTRTSPKTSNGFGSVGDIERDTNLNGSPTFSAGRQPTTTTTNPPFARVGVTRTQSNTTSTNNSNGGYRAERLNAHMKSSSNSSVGKEKKWNSSFAVGDLKNQRVSYDARLATMERQAMSHMSPKPSVKSITTASGRPRVTTYTTRLNERERASSFTSPALRRESTHDPPSPLDTVNDELGATLPRHMFAKINGADGVSPIASSSGNDNDNNSPWPTKRETVGVLTSAAESLQLNSPGNVGVRSTTSRNSSTVGLRSSRNSIDTSSNISGTATLPGGVNGVPKENQDSFFFITGNKRGDFAVGVLDGHGFDGRKVSSFVSKCMKNELQRYFDTGEEGVDRSDGLSKSTKDTQNDDVGDKIVAALTAAFHAADLKLRATPNGAIESSESGSTAVVVVRQGSVLVTANVGDSRAVLVNAGRKESRNGLGSGRSNPSYVSSSYASPKESTTVTAFDLSDDHKPDRVDELARIRRCGGVVEQARAPFGLVGPHRVWLKTTPRSGGLAVSRAFGDLRLEPAGVVARPEITVNLLSSDSRNGKDSDTAVSPLCVVLASDGVWDHVPSKLAASISAAPFLTSRLKDARLNTPTDETVKQKCAKSAADAITARAVQGWRNAANGGYRDDITVAVVPLV